VSVVTVAGIKLSENIWDDLKTSDYKNNNSSRQKLFWLRFRLCLLEKKKVRRRTRRNRIRRRIV